MGSASICHTFLRNTVWWLWWERCYLIMDTLWEVAWEITWVLVSVLIHIHFTLPQGLLRYTQSSEMNTNFRVGFYTPCVPGNVITYVSAQPLNDLLLPSCHIFQALVYLYFTSWLLPRLSACQTWWHWVVSSPRPMALPCIPPGMSGNRRLRLIFVGSPLSPPRGVLLTYCE